MQPASSSRRGEEGVNAAPSSPVCSEPDCTEPRQTVKQRDRIVVVSDYCTRHTNVPLFDEPVEHQVDPKPKPKRVPRLKDVGGEPLSAFHSEVKRQRLQREDGLGGNPTPAYHGAQFTPAVLNAIVPVLARWGLPVHDP